MLCAYGGRPLWHSNGGAISITFHKGAQVWIRGHSPTITVFAISICWNYVMYELCINIPPHKPIKQITQCFPRKCTTKSLLQFTSVTPQHNVDGLTPIKKNPRIRKLTNNLATPEEINEDIRHFLGGGSSTACMVYRLNGFNQPALHHESPWITTCYSHINVEQNLWNSLWDKSNYSPLWTKLLRINS